LTILLGNGDGTFTAVTPNPVVGYYPFSVIAGDFNGDGIPDLAVGNVMNSTVSILLGKGDGTFTSEPELNTGGGVGSLVTADFNGDGIPDLAVVAGSSVLVFMGKGDGTFGPTPVSLLAGTSPAGIAAGDLNGDGIMDLVVANDAESGSVTEFLGNVRSLSGLPRSDEAELSRAFPTGAVSIGTFEVSRWRLRRSR
jgi:hypothetical protein